MLSKRNTLSWVIGLMIFLVCAWLIKYFIFTDNNQGGTLDSAASRAQPTSSRVSSSSDNTTSASMPSSVSNIAQTSNVNSTYRPGQTRALRQYLGVIDRNNTASDWWLYAKSEAEAQWMDTYGYPTPAEEAKLNAATLEELKKMKDAGDMNARAHWVSRRFSAAFESTDPIERSNMRGQIEGLLTEGGPYQATKILQAYGKLLADYSAIPTSQRTEDQANFIMEHGMNFKAAEVSASIFSDDAAKSMRDNIIKTFGGNRFSQILSGTDKNGHYPAEAVASQLSYGSTIRAYKRLPPLVILPRPKVPEGATPYYLERY